MKRHGHYLQEEGLKKYGLVLPRLSLRKGKKLTDLVVKVKLKQEGGKSGPYRRRCKLCEHMEVVSEVKDKDGKRMKIKGVMVSGLVGAVYGMCCRTQRRFKGRR